MALRLTFVPSTLPGTWDGVEGADAAAVLDAWNALPQWAGFAPADFRQRLVYNTGAEVPGGMPAADEEILRAVVEAAGPADLRLETSDGAGSRVGAAVNAATRAISQAT